jgi:hypothetical protein
MRGTIAENRQLNDTNRNAKPKVSQPQITFYSPFILEDFTNRVKFRSVFHIFIS